MLKETEECSYGPNEKKKNAVKVLDDKIKLISQPHCPIEQPQGKLLTLSSAS